MEVIAIKTSITVDPMDCTSSRRMLARSPARIRSLVQSREYTPAARRDARSFDWGSMSRGSNWLVRRFRR